MSIVIGGIAPHPPLIIPDIGRGELQAVEQTVNAMKNFAKQMAAAAPETFVIITPHGAMFRDALSFVAEDELYGDFLKFGAPQVKLRAKNDTELLEAIIKCAEDENIEIVKLSGKGSGTFGDESALDHGTTVPLFYLQEAGTGGNLISITYGLLPAEDLFSFGKALSRAVEKLGRRTAVIASGDLSHRLTRDAPAGYHPRGKEFDEKLTEYVSEYQVEEILKMDEDLVASAGECGLRSIIVLLGSLSDKGFKPEVLSYEGPFGVGYLVSLFKQEEG